jgi:hypothetical protein
MSRNKKHTHTHRVEGKICIYCTCAGIMSESRVQVILTNTFFIGRRKYMEAAIAVTIVSDYRLDNWATGVRSPAKALEFSLYPLCPDQL